jgi:hypothetical protein
MSETASVLLSWFSHVPYDILVAVLIVGVLFFLGATKSKDILLSLLFVLYPVILITYFFPFYTYLQFGNTQHPAVIGYLLVFVLTYVAVYTILRGYIHTHYQHHSFWRMTELVVLSVAIVGLLFASMYHITDAHVLYDFSLVFDTLFSSSLAFFIWLVTPLVSIPLFIRS